MSKEIVKKLLSSENNLRLNRVVEQTTAVNPLKDHIHQIVEDTAMKMKYDYYIDEKISKSLQKKSDASEIPLSILEEVFLRGCFVWEQIESNISRTEFSFNRVNSYISGGLSKKELDSDLNNLTESKDSAKLIMSAHEHAYNKGIEYYKNQKKLNRENHNLRPENGMRVKIYGEHKHAGKEGIITQVSPSMQYVSVKTKGDKHIGIHHISNIKHLHAEA